MPGRKTKNEGQETVGENRKDGKPHGSYLVRKENQRKRLDKAFSHRKPKRDKRKKRGR